LASLSGWPQLSQTVVGSGWMLMPVLSASAARGYSKPGAAPRLQTAAVS
jgi:hypothetical protein